MGYIRLLILGALWMALASCGACVATNCGSDMAALVKSINDNVAIGPGTRQTLCSSFIDRSKFIGTNCVISWQ